MLNTIFIIITLLVMLVGIVGAFLPLIPSAPLIFLSALLYAFLTKFENITGSIILILLIIAVVSQLLDYLAGVYGAKKFGASKWGMLGALLGGITGIIFGGFLGLIIGPFFGAILFEIILGKKMFKESVKIGLGTLLGMLCGSLGKFIFAIMMVAIFIWSII